MDSLRLPHISAYIREGRAVVEVRDDELWNKIDDYLKEQCDLGYEYLLRLTGGGPYLMVFPPQVSLSEVIVALNKLDPSEVDRIYRINNPEGNEPP